MNITYAQLLAIKNLLPLINNAVTKSELISSLLCCGKNDASELIRFVEWINSHNPSIDSESDMFHYFWYNFDVEKRIAMHKWYVIIYLTHIVFNV